jgi:transcriptional regulator with XRE-family HTH domain
MTGEELKKRLKKTGLKQGEMAQLLGMPNPQALYQALKADDVKSGLIEDCCRKLGLSIVELYEGDDLIIASDNSTAFKGNGNTVNTVNGTDKFIELLNKKDEQIDRLLTIIEKMKV